ncbi:asparagine synthase B [Prescottella subtropica]|uniref:asparagine synthase B n=1 Tax=Prescottella subtropica TaxID=2545757 RepID=UPI0019D5B66B|nr:asparagine synthase B [Prescottella subtropica]
MFLPVCSIFGIFGLSSGDDHTALRAHAVELSRRQRHRGPDWSGVFADDGAILVHERLAIVDPASGAQPLRSRDGRLALAVNGEIYNHRELRDGLDYDFTTGSDSEVVNALYRSSGGTDFVSALNGIFAFALWDRDRQAAIIARDPIGVCPLYWGHDAAGRLLVASELKALVDVCDDAAQFPPGHVYDTATGELHRFHHRTWREHDATAGVTIAPETLRASFEQAVRRQLMTDVPYGVLLSGGLDSSLVAACAAKFARDRIEDDDRSEAWWPRLHSFAIGLDGSPDLAAAEKAADMLGTAHHGFVYTFEEGLDALPEVIRHIETYDVTTIRASTPMFLLARRIKAMGVKMVLSGEGADEIFGGYLYFHKAPSAEAFHEETVRKLDALHNYDCLRANKSMMAWGIEARVPFLDLEFLDTAMGIDAAAKMAGGGRIEKHIVREAFDGALPDEILWRQKEQFSDGVGYGWIDGLKDHAELVVTDAEFSDAAARFPHNTPDTKEAFLYRSIFDRHFPGDAAAQTVPGGKSIACSTPAALEWDPEFAALADPSGRAVRDVHDRALDA